MAMLKVTRFKESTKYDTELEIYVPDTLVDLGETNGFYDVRKYVEANLKEYVGSGYVVIMEDNIVGFPMLIDGKNY